MSTCISMFEKKILQTIPRSPFSVKFLIIFSFFFLISSFLFASDFGLIMNHFAGYGTSENSDRNVFEYSGSLVPRYSRYIGDNISIFVSGQLTFGYKEKFTLVPEILRTEFYISLNAWEIKAGRIYFQDSLGFIAEGLFDGAQGFHTSNIGRFSFGAHYTGFQYKQTAKISMNMNDFINNVIPFAYSDFFNTYFAPRRLFFNAGWENPFLFNFLRLSASVIGQFDVSGGYTKYHSQYLLAKAGVPLGRFLFEAGGGFSLIQEDKQFGISFYAEGTVSFDMPLSFQSRLSLSARYATGDSDGTIKPFTPITTEYAGSIFRAKMSALTAFSLEYSARFINPLGVRVWASYFIRNDLTTYNTFPIESDGSRKKLLGAEIAASAVWNPVSDIQLIMGGGMFLPKLGNNWKDEKPKWRADITLIVSLY